MAIGKTMSPKNEIDILCPICGETFKSEQEMLEHHYSEHSQASGIMQAEPDAGKRPVGLTLISVVWLLFGLFNIYSALQTINIDLENLPYLSGYGVPEWFNVAIPVEMVLSITALCLGLLQVVTVFGLLKGKKYSYKLGLGIPIALPVINILFVALYLSAPVGVDLNINVGLYGGLIGGGIFWAVIYWQYLRKPHVKAYLGIIEASSKTPKSERRKILNRKIVLSVILIFSIIAVGTVGYIASLPSTSTKPQDSWTTYKYSLEADSQYTITLFGTNGFSFESWRYVTSTHWASTEFNSTQSSLTVSGDLMSLNAYFVPKEQSVKGSTASITLFTTSNIQLDLEVSYGTATIVRENT